MQHHPLPAQNYGEMFLEGGNLMPESNDFLANVLDLKSLIRYQKNSVVSKQLLNKKAGTLTLFAFDKGEGLSEHTAPYDASVLILDGTAGVKIGGKLHKLKKDEMIIMPAHVPHSLKAIQPFKMLLTMIRSAE